jgi:hypothetical protein
MHPTSLPDGGEPRDWARAIGPGTFDELKKLAFESESAATKLGAIKEILDRGYGRSPLAGGGDPENEAPIVYVLNKDTIWTTDPSKAIPDPARR